eukprot:6474915-Amphidinium_carterae.1
MIQLKQKKVISCTTTDRWRLRSVGNPDLGSPDGRWVIAASASFSLRLPKGRARSGFVYSTVRSEAEV